MSWSEKRCAAKAARSMRTLRNDSCDLPFWELLPFLAVDSDLILPKLEQIFEYSRMRKNLLAEQQQTDVSTLAPRSDIDDFFPSLL